jgi:hypothetical protein
LRSRSSPPCSRTIARAADSPRPTPPVLRCRAERPAETDEAARPVEGDRHALVAVVVDQRQEQSGVG